MSASLLAYLRGRSFDRLLDRRSCHCRFPPRLAVDGLQGTVCVPCRTSKADHGDNRLSHFRRIVNSNEEEKIVDVHRLASLALTGLSPVPEERERRRADAPGIPDEHSLRPRTWKLLLRLLPPNKDLWEATLYDKRCQYYVSFLPTQLHPG